MTAKYNENEECWEIKNRLIDVEFEVYDDIEYNENEQKEIMIKTLTRIEENWDKLNQNIINSLWKLYNEEWREEGDPYLSENEFLKKIIISVVVIEIAIDEYGEIKEIIEIEYEDSDLFRGHTIVMEWFPDG
ncbi:MAG: DUF2262 domain-containing protein [Promethearchaeota archaeon]